MATLTNLTRLASSSAAVCAALALLLPSAACSKDDKKAGKNVKKSGKTGKTDGAKKGVDGKPGDNTGGMSSAVARVGHPAPQFAGKAHTGEDISLAKLRGNPVVLYFYPKDETPG